MKLISQVSFNTDSTIISIFEEKNEAKRLDLLIKSAHEIKSENLYQSIHLFKYAYEIAKKLNLKKEELYCTYHIAESSCRLSNFHNALKYYKEYGTLSKELNDTQQVANSYFLMGYTYYNLKNYIKCEESYIKALKYYSLIKNKNNISYCYNNLGLIYAEEDYDKALFYYKKAYNVNKQAGNIYNCSINMNNIACMYLYKGEIEKVKPILDSALTIADDLGYKQALYLIYSSYGEYYQAIKNYKTTEIYYLKAIKILDNNEEILEKQDILDLLIKFYEKIGDSVSAYHYYKRYITNKDSLQKISNEKLFLKQEHQEEVKKIELKNSKQLHIQKKKEYKYQYIIFFVSVLLIFVLGAFYMTRRGNRRKKKLLLENQKLKNKFFLEKIENKNKELISKTILLSERNDLIKDVTCKLISCRPNLKKANVEIIQGVIENLNSNLNEKQWEDFQNNFKNLHPDFYSNLLKKFPNLSPHDLRLCSFLKLNMSSKEIAKITYVETNSVDVARSRIRKKFKLSNSNLSLQSFLASF
ncbi:MAG: tetratricopeptide repeat protein [Bacteroidetes bacterium]|nr:tetratricopeptide repeat protein [Bacteroidota bacterium]